MRAAGKALTINGTADHARRAFGWQAGYAAFSVSQSNVSAVLKYIAGQEEHHRKATFQGEFVAYLKKNGIEYDERYLWG